MCQMMPTVRFCSMCIPSHQAKTDNIIKVSISTILQVPPTHTHIHRCPSGAIFLGKFQCLLEVHVDSRSFPCCCPCMLQYCS